MGIDDIINGLTSVLFAPLIDIFFSLSKAIWDTMIGLCTGTMTKTPEAFSGDTWNFVMETLYPWSMSIGIAALNLFFMIGFCRAFMNLRENITLELCVDAMIRLVAANLLLVMGIELINVFFGMAARLTGQVVSIQDIPFYTVTDNAGSAIFWTLFGGGYFIVSLICSIMIFLTVYGRYIKLYLLVVFYPVAMPTMIGGRGVENTASAWVKAFLSNTFEILVIALVMTIGGRLISAVRIPDSMFSAIFSGFGAALSSLVSMILMTASIKNVPTFMNKCFNL